MKIKIQYKNLSLSKNKSEDSKKNISVSVFSKGESISFLLDKEFLLSREVVSLNPDSIGVTQKDQMETTITNNQVATPEKSQILTIDQVMCEIEKKVADKLELESEFIISSDISWVLDLPWQEKNKNCVKEVATSIAREHTSDDNFLMLLSYGCDDQYINICDDLANESIAIVRAITTSRKQIQTRPHNFRLVSSLSKGVLSTVDWDSYSIWHFSMHGKEDGSLGCEHSCEFAKLDWIAKSDFMSTLQAANGAFLVFLSACNSGLGDMKDSSLAFDLIDKGYAKYVIAFSGAMSSEELPEFVKIFYEAYFVERDVELSFKKSKDYLEKANPKYKSVPVLYRGVI